MRGHGSKARRRLFTHEAGCRDCAELRGRRLNADGSDECADTNAGREDHEGREDKTHGSEPTR